MPIVLLHPNTGTCAIWEEPNRRICAGRLPRHRVRSPRLGQERRRSGDRSAAGQHRRRSRRAGRASRARQIPSASASPAAASLRWIMRRGGRSGCAASSSAARTGAIADQEIADFIARIAIPDIRKQSAHYRELGPSYRGANPEGTQRWIEIDETCAPAGRRLSAAAAHAEYAWRRSRPSPTPTLVIAADADLLAPPALMRLWARTCEITNGRSFTMPAMPWPGSSRAVQRSRAGLSRAALNGPR